MRYFAEARCSSFISRLSLSANKLSVRFGSPKAPIVTGKFFPISAVFRSKWMTAAFAAKISSSAGNTSGITVVPQIKTASAAEVYRLLSSPTCARHIPLKRGWEALIFTSEEFAPHTAAPSNSATLSSSSWAPDAAIPSPMSISGWRDSASRRAASAMVLSSGVTFEFTRGLGTTVSVFFSSSMSSGRARKTGPKGGVRAVLMARRVRRSGTRI